MNTAVPILAGKQSKMYFRYFINTPGWNLYAVLVQHLENVEIP